jgi:hypothetical protein
MHAGCMSGCFAQSTLGRYFARSLPARDLRGCGAKQCCWSWMPPRASRCGPGMPATRYPCPYACSACMRYSKPPASDLTRASDRRTSWTWLSSTRIPAACCSGLCKLTSQVHLVDRVRHCIRRCTLYAHTPACSSSVCVVHQAFLAPYVFLRGCYIYSDLAADVNYRRMQTNNRTQTTIPVWPGNRGRDRMLTPQNARTTTLLHSCTPSLPEHHDYRQRLARATTRTPYHHTAQHHARKHQAL